MEFRDLKAQYKRYKVEIDSAIEKVLLSSRFIGGQVVDELEGILAKYIGVKHCISCANGTDALTLPLMAWGIGKGDAVFVPDFTFFATAEVVSFLGATPIFIDIDSNTFNIDTESLERAIIRVNEEGGLIPRCIIPVDLFGLPANYIEIERIAKKYNLLVLEDAAQGFGGVFEGKKACGFGDVAATSFFPAKPLGCYGDGGAIFTDDDNLAHLIRSLKNHGQGKDRYDNINIGINSRLDAIQAAILKIKFHALIEHELKEVNQVAQWYTNRLSDYVEVPIIPLGYYSCFAQYTIKLKTKEMRDLLQNQLKEKGIPTMIYYGKPLHKQEAFKGLKFDDNNFTVSNELCNRVLSLPIHPYLDEETVEEICSVIIKSI